MAASRVETAGASANPATIFTRTFWMAALLFSVIALGFACLSGGWWGLGRVDPLLVVPGLGYAAVIATWSRNGSVNLQRKPLLLLLPLLLVLLAAAIGMGFAHQLALGQLVALWVAATASLTLAALLHRFAGTWQMLWRLLLAMALAMLWQWGSWPVIDGAYAVPVRAERSHILLLSGLPLDAAGQDMSTTLRTGLARAPMLDFISHGAMVTRTEAITQEQLRRADVLFLAHPRALPPEQLVLIDTWVRGGGSVLIAADGLWSSPPPFALGDPRNPPITSLLTPLLTHWGLRLDAPAGLVERAVATRHDGQHLNLLSPGTLAPITDDAALACDLTSSHFIAHCTIGAGRAVIIADADWLALAQWAPISAARPAGAVASWRAGNMVWLMDRLDDLTAHPAHPLPPRPLPPRLRGLAEPVWVR